MPRFKFSDIAHNIRESRAPTPADEATYIGLEHLDADSLTVSRWGSEVPLKGNKLQMKKGDLLFGKRNAYLRRAAIAPHDGLFSAHGMVFRPNTDVIDKNLFPFFICSDAVFDAAIRISVGSLSPTVNWRDLSELEFVLPSMGEQAKAAEKLWAANEARESYRRLISLVDELVKSQFVEMFGDSKQETVKTLKEVGSVSGGLTKNAKRNMLEIRKPYLRVANVFFNRIDSSDIQTIGVKEEEIQPTLLQKNDLLIVEGNGNKDQIGRVALWDASVPECLHQNHIIKVRLSSAVNPVFVVHYFMSDFGRTAILNRAYSTTGLFTLSVGKVEELPIPVFSRSLQDRFAAFVAAADKSKFAARQSLERLDAVYRALSKETFG